MSAAVDVLMLFIGFIYCLAWSTVKLCEWRRRQIERRVFLERDGWL